MWFVTAGPKPSFVWLQWTTEGPQMRETSDSCSVRLAINRKVNMAFLDATVSSDYSTQAARQGEPSVSPLAADGIRSELNFLPKSFEPFNPLQKIW